MQAAGEVGLEPRDTVLQGQGCGDVTQLQLQWSLPHGHPGRDSLAFGSPPGTDPLRGPLSAPTEGGSGPQAVQDTQMGALILSSSPGSDQDVQWGRGSLALSPLLSWLYGLG